MENTSTTKCWKLGDKQWSCFYDECNCHLKYKAEHRPTCKCEECRYWGA